MRLNFSVYILLKKVRDFLMDFIQLLIKEFVNSFKLYFGYEKNFSLNYAVIYRNICKPISWYCRLNQLFITVHFIVGHFSLYHPLGRMVLFAMAYSLFYFTGNPQTWFMPYKDIFICYISFTFYCFFIVYFLVQFEYWRDLLRSAIGSKAFSDFVGD